MKLKNNLEFPYPTILNEPIYYDKSTIKFQSLIEVSNSSIKMNYVFTINSDFVNYLLYEKICSAYLIIESDYSVYREMFEVTTFNEEVKITLDVDKLQNKIDITPIIVLNTNFSNFTSDEFKQSNISYSAAKNDIIGYIEPLEFYLDNYNSIFPSLANVITIKNHANNNKDLTYSLDEEQIVIFINDVNTYEKLQEINLDTKFTFTLYQTLILPVLIDALLHLNDAKYEDYRWFRLLQNKVVSAKKQIPSTYKQAFSIAQILLEHPTHYTINELHNLRGQNE